MTFALSTGETFYHKNDYSDRKYLRILMKRVMVDGSLTMTLDDDFESRTDRIVEAKVQLISLDGEAYEVFETYALAVNENYKEYPEIEDYLDGGFSSWADYYHKAEVTFQIEKWRKRIYLEWKGNLSLLAFTDDLKGALKEELEEKRLEDQGVSYTAEKIVAVGLHAEDGDWVDTEIDLDEFLQSVVSVRVVEFREDELQS